MTVPIGLGSASHGLKRTLQRPSPRRAQNPPPQAVGAEAGSAVTVDPKERRKLLDRLVRQLRPACERFLQETLAQPANARFLATRLSQPMFPQAVLQEIWRFLYQLLAVLKVDASASMGGEFLWLDPATASSGSQNSLAKIIRAVPEARESIRERLIGQIRRWWQCRAGRASLLTQMAWDSASFSQLVASLTHLRESGKSAGKTQAVPYAELESEDLGRIHELLLEIEAGIAAEPMSRLRRGRIEVVVPRAQSRHYRAGRSTSKSEPEVIGNLDVDDATPDSDEPLASGVRWVADLPPGQFFLRTGLTRKGAGAYYTPRAFVRFLVQATLGPTVTERSPDHDPRPAAIVGITVLDPAMGTGHFLIEACRFLGRKLLEACQVCASRMLDDSDSQSQQWRERVITCSDEGEALWQLLKSDPQPNCSDTLPLSSAERLCRQIVARNCLYGVDRNGLSVEMARLTLALEVGTSGLSPEQFESHLIAGDSLAGPRIVDLQRLPGFAATQLPQHLWAGLQRRIAQSAASLGTANTQQATRQRELCVALKVVAAAWSGGVQLGEDRCDEQAWLALVRQVVQRGRLPEKLVSFELPNDNSSRPDPSGQWREQPLHAMLARGLGIDAVPAERGALEALIDSGQCLPAVSFELTFPEVFSLSEQTSRIPGEEQGEGTESSKLERASSPGLTATLSRRALVSTHLENTEKLGGRGWTEGKPRCRLTLQKPGLRKRLQPRPPIPFHASKRCVDTNACKAGEGLWAAAASCVTLARSGFDVVLGNPPWEAVRPQRTEFFGNYDVACWAGHTRRERSAAEKRLLNDPVIARRYASYLDQIEGTKRVFDRLYERQKVFIDGDLAGRYLDQYRVFLERKAQLASRDGGRVGVVVPAAFRANAGAVGLRKLYLLENQMEFLYTFRNTRQSFEVASGMQFCLLVSRFSTPAIPAVEAERTFEMASHLEDEAWLLAKNRTPSPLSYPIKLLEAVGGPHLTIVDFASEAELEVTRRLMAETLPLGNHPLFANIPFQTNPAALNATTDAWRLQATADVCAGDPRDPALAAEISLRSYAPLHEKGTFSRFQAREQTQPRYVVDLRKCDDRPDWLEQLRHFRLVGRSTIHASEPQKTVFALIPPGGLVSNSAVVEATPEQRTLESALCALAILNSHVFNFLARQQVVLNLNLFILRNLRVPAEIPQKEFLARSALRLSANDVSYAEPCDAILGMGWREKSRSKVRPAITGVERLSLEAAMNAVIAQAYGATSADYALVLEQGAGQLTRKERSVTLQAFERLLADGMASFVEQYDPSCRTDLPECSRAA